MKIQWYPGHMTKARRAMEEDMKKVDAVVEILDARVPKSSRNPDIDALAMNKMRLVVLNKSDLSSEAETRAWVRSFADSGIKAILIDGRTKTAKRAVLEALTDVCRPFLEKQRKKGFLNPQIRAMVVGIPNVGKSTVINSLAGRASMKTGNKPGVTKSNQWLKVSDSVQLLDTPGILWPKFSDETVGTHLAMIGSVSDEIINKTELADEILLFFGAHFPERIAERFGIEFSADSERISALTEIGRKRGALKSGGEIDLLKAANILTDEFRSGKLGRVTLENCNEKGQ